MTAVHALLVGIDRYGAPEVGRLSGCGNDIRAARELLDARCAPGTGLHVVSLLDGEATRGAVIDGFRRHLRRAGPGDTALFWFSGHGSTVRIPPRYQREYGHLEPTGALQTLVCADSRTGGVPDLLDKELAILLDEVAAGGCHVVAVVDSCHSGGVTRGGDCAGAPVRARVAGPAGMPAPDRLLPELGQRYATGAPAVRAVTLAACRSVETAHEMPLDGEVRGVFSWALANALRRGTPATTYRDLLTVARGEVERWRSTQLPQLDPVTGDLADQPFLGGLISRPAAGVTVRHGADGWVADAGHCHGLPDGSRADPVQLAVTGSDPVVEFRVTGRSTTRSTVVPVGWEPDPGRVYRAVLSRVPAPPTAVEAPPDLAAWLAPAVATAGPGGLPSPYVRLVGAGTPAQLRVGTGSAGVPQILDADGTVLHRAADVPALEHVARWRQVRELHNPLSRLTGAARLEVLEVRPGEGPAALHRPALPPGPDGGFTLSYSWGPGGWTPPDVYLRVRNMSSRRLFCALLDLTDSFRIHSELLPCTLIEPGLAAVACGGDPVGFDLPPHRPVAPRQSVRDWLVLLVTEEEFDARAFDLTGVGAGPTGRGGTRAPVAFDSLLASLGQRALYRDLRPQRTGTACDWATVCVPVLTVVPDVPSAGW